jgi:replicative DNA helicase
MTTPQLEKIYFNYILNNKKYFDIIKPYFFRNSEIQFVYDVIRNYMIKSSENKVPTNRQILDMVNIEDKEGIITKEILKSILKVDLSEYSEKDFILPKFNSWILTNRIKTSAIDIVDETRGLEDVVDFNKAVEAANRIRGIIEEMSSTNFVQDDDLGSDFDEPENHVQDSSKFKVKCGFETIDHMLGGGWDVQTLNVIMAATNNGKCTFFDTNIFIKNKYKNGIYSKKIGRIFTEVRKKCNLK